MTSSGQERIVVHLIRIPAVKVCRCAPQTTFHKGHEAAKTSSRISPRDRCEIMIRRRRKNCLHGSVVVHSVSVVTEPHRIDKTLIESMRFLDGHNLPLGEGSKQHYAQRVVIGERCPVEHVSAKEAVVLGEMVVNACGEKIFSDDSMSNKIVSCRIRTRNRRSIRQWK